MTDRAPTGDGFHRASPRCDWSCLAPPHGRCVRDAGHPDRGPLCTSDGVVAWNLDHPEAAVTGSAGGHSGRNAAVVRAAEAFVAALDVDGEEPAELRELIAAVRGESGGADG